ncbi:MAG: hypothetical protein WAV08_16445, partial [Desulfobacterales bacterium]
LQHRRNQFVNARLLLFAGTSRDTKNFHVNTFQGTGKTDYGLRAATKTVARRGRCMPEFLS